MIEIVQNFLEVSGGQLVIRVRMTGDVLVCSTTGIIQKHKHHYSLLISQETIFKRSVFVSYEVKNEMIIIGPY